MYEEQQCPEIKRKWIPGSNDEKNKYVFYKIITLKIHLLYVTTAILKNCKQC